MQGKGFWLKYNKKILLESSHIQYMRNNIEEFEITKEHFEEVYKKYGEKIPFEGFARNDLIKEAINNGWIRIREYTGYWSINCRNIEEQKEIIDKFIKEEIFDKKTILINGEIY